jgi:hypothetical protein
MPCHVAPFFLRVQRCRRRDTGLLFRYAAATLEDPVHEQPIRPTTGNSNVASKLALEPDNDIALGSGSYSSVSGGHRRSATGEYNWAAGNLSENF